MEIQKEIKEIREKLESLEKQISSKHEFANGWNYFETLEKWLVLNPKSDCSFDLAISVDDGYFTKLGKWKPSDIESHRPSTPSEIKDALVKVCEKMGIVPGAKINVLRPIKSGERWDYVSVSRGSENPLEKIGKAWYYNSATDTLYNWGYGLGIVYEKGQFATVVKEEEVKIGGYKCEWTQDKDILKVGCKEFPYRWVSDLRGTMQNFKINHVLIEHEEIELETIVKILNLRK